MNVIATILKKNEEFQKAIAWYIANKSTKKIYSKVSEELSELNVNLIKCINSTDKVPVYKIIEELIDVHINLAALEAKLDSTEFTLQEIIEMKITKMLISKNFKNYEPKSTT